jgi:hypothetical protein
VLAAAAQSAPYHPVTLLSTCLPAPDAFTFIASMTYFLAALSAFLFFRALSISELPALVGAAGWCFSMYVVSFIETAHGSAVALLPLALFGVHRIVERPGLRSATEFGLTMTLLTLCGHPETLLHIGTLSVVYAVAHAGRKIVRVINAVAAAGMATALLTAVFLVPIIEAIPQTDEYRNRAAVRPSDRHPSSWPVVLHLLRYDFIPFTESLVGVEVAQHPASVRHSLANTAYAGSVLIVPAIYALWRARRNVVWFFACLMLFGILAGAEAPGLTYVFARLPLFNLSITARMLSFASFAFCALAAIGLEQWLADGQRLDRICRRSSVPLSPSGAANHRGARTRSDTAAPRVLSPRCRL